MFVGKFKCNTYKIQRLASILSAKKYSGKAESRFMLLIFLCIEGENKSYNYLIL